MAHPSAATVGQLIEFGYKPMSVKDELRKNLIRKLKAGEELFPGIVGYRETVIPQIINGLLSKHDLLFLGLRGQAKTRILRMLPDLLDEWMPVLSDVEINDDPIAPMTTTGKASRRRNRGRMRRLNGCIGAIGIMRSWRRRM